MTNFIRQTFEQCWDACKSLNVEIPERIKDLSWRNLIAATIKHYGDNREHYAVKQAFPRGFDFRLACYQGLTYTCPLSITVSQFSSKRVVAEQLKVFVERLAIYHRDNLFIPFKKAGLRITQYHEKETGERKYILQFQSVF